jgi:ferredoxin
VEVLFMKVWIDQQYCTGDGLCTDLCPLVFSLGDDGLAYVQQDGKVLPGEGEAALAVVPAGAEADAREAANQCTGECITIIE